MTCSERLSQAMLVAQGHLAIARGQERVGQAPCADLRHEAVNLDLSRRVLPAFKIGKHWRYRRADLEEWMVRQRDVA